MTPPFLANKKEILRKNCSTQNSSLMVKTGGLLYVVIQPEFSSPICRLLVHFETYCHIKIKLILKSLL